MFSCLCHSRKGTAAGELQLHWLRTLEMWVRMVWPVIIVVVIFDPLLRGGGEPWRLQVQALDTRASQQMVALTNCKQNVWGEVAVWFLVCTPPPAQ